jgi:hypothetical protein
MQTRASALRDRTPPVSIYARGFKAPGLQAAVRAARLSRLAAESCCLAVCDRALVDFAAPAAGLGLSLLDELLEAVKIAADASGVEA